VGGTVWYRFQSTGTGGLVASTAGTDYPTALAAFSGSPFEGGNSLGCSRDPRGNSILAFPSVAGATYYFQIGGPLHGGNLVFTLARKASTSYIGGAGDGLGTRPRISANGRFVAFQAGTGSAKQVYVRDLESRTTESVSVSSRGRIANRAAGEPDISADGRYVSFHSAADNLVPGDTNTENSFKNLNGSECSARRG